MAILNKLLFALLQLLRFIIGILPTSLALAIGKIIGICSFIFFKKRRQRALNNLQLAFGETYTPKQQRQITKQVFINLGWNAIEFLRQHQVTSANLSQFVTFHGLEHLQHAREKNHGILALTAHLGNWELLTASMSLSGINTGVVVKSARQPAVEKFLIQQRTASGLQILRGKNLIKPILKLLRNNGMVGIVLDQSAISREGIAIPFFGHVAWTMKSLAILAMRTPAAVLPIYTYRINHHHHIIVQPPIVYQHNSDNTDDEITARTMLYTASIEQIIREHPEQWSWTHNRWKKRKLKTQ